LVKEFEEEYEGEVRLAKGRKIKEACKGELPERYMAKILYG